MKIRKAAALISTTNNSDERFESKKQRVSDEVLQLDDAPETEPAIVVTTDDAKPIDCVEKVKSCKPRKPREKIYNGPNPTPDIPIEFKNKIQSIGGKDWRLIIQKGLSDTDVSKAHARLSMPSSQWIADQGLFDSEFGKNGTIKNYVSLPLIDTKMKVWPSVSLKKWMLSKAMVVISGGWNNVVDANGLKVKDVVQIWCFKFVETGRFGLAMVKIENDRDVSSPESERSLSSSCIHPQSPPVTYFDFLNIESFATAAESNGCDQELVVTDGVVVSSSEAVVLTVVDDDIDLSLHL